MITEQMLEFKNLPFRDIRKSQKDFVKEVLHKNGFITRNQCLRNYISRLGAIIGELKEAGWKFDAYYLQLRVGKDFVYEVSNYAN